jgi:hypothetical protein
VRDRPPRAARGRAARRHPDAGLVAIAIGLAVTAGLTVAVGLGETIRDAETERA